MHKERDDTMEFKQLKYFIEVARREHVSETALDLNVAQSAISRQISLLEQELNVALFTRQGRNIVLTTEGKMFFNEAVRILEQLDKTVSQFQSHALTKQKQLYIGYEESDVSRMLLPLIKSFNSQQDAQIIPTIKDAQSIYEEIISGHIDLGLTELTSHLQTHKQLNVTPLFEEHFQLYAPKADPVTLTTYPPLHQFESKHIYCLTPFADSVKKQLQQLVKTEVHMISDEQLAQYLLLQNQGYVISAQNKHLAKSEDWVSIPLNYTELKRTICVVTKEHYHKRDITSLLELVLKLMSKTTTFY